MNRQNKKIIITRKIWQLIAVTGFALMVSFSRYYPLGFRFGIHLFASIFLTVSYLTYRREERRAMYPADSDLVINCNLSESVLLLLSILAFFVIAFIKHFDEHFFYAYFHTSILGLLVGVVLGEFLWQNTRLKNLDEIYRQRYWANYKDSIW